MHIVFIIFGLLLLSDINGNEVVNIDIALERAKAENKTVLMIFSGSDWCKPCIQLKKEVLSTNEFQSFCSQELVVLNLDFPYKKSSEISEDQKRHNELMAEKYNQEGRFPKVLLLDHGGNVKGSIQYKKGMTTGQFIRIIRQAI